MPPTTCIDIARIKAGEVQSVRHSRTMLYALQIKINNLVHCPSVKRTQDFG
jgi:hypothetical protein